MNDDVDGFFLSRFEQRTLVALLREVPDLVRDLAVALTVGGDPTKVRFGAPVTMGERERPLPFNAGAQDAADELRTELWGWARHVCECRAIDYTGGAGTAEIAHWLDRNVIALALTEGSETAPESIGYVIRAARRTTGVSAGRERIIDEDLVVLCYLGVSARVSIRISRGSGHGCSRSRPC
ncbi:hypothetical protein ACFVJ2_45005, partial [Rhodococcus jostii]